MRTIYAVTEGEYSSYSVLCTFDAEDDARAAVEAGIGDDYTTLTLYSEGERPAKVITWSANAMLFRDHVTRARFDEEYRRLSDQWRPNVWSSENWDAYGTPPRRPRLEERDDGIKVVLHAQGSDREATLKVVADRYAALLAEFEGLT